MLAKRCTRRLTTASSVELPEVAERDLPLIDIDALLQQRHGSEGFNGARGGSEDSEPAVTRRSQVWGPKPGAQAKTPVDADDRG